MKIGINCGHTVDGQPGSGAVGYISESVETRNVGRKLISLLKQCGHIVYDCTDDYATSTSDNLNTIVSIANAQPLDLFISIHFNSGGGKGTEVFTYDGMKHAEAVNVCNALHSLGFKNRGVKDGSKLAVVRRSKAKAMLIEVCFVDTADADLYKNIGAERIAQAICEAVTGAKANNTISEYTESNNIIWELHHRGIISDSLLWLNRCNTDTNVYWFCRKLCQYIRTKTDKENAKNEYTEINDISWDLNHRGVISDIALWESQMQRDNNIYWLMRKGLHYCRTH